MTDEKPLHVRVAEALGWDYAEDKHEWDEAPEGRKQCIRCGEVASWTRYASSPCAPSYDTDWSATGPLIERYRITVEAPIRRFPEWSAAVYDQHGIESSDRVGGPTPLLAVCALILTLKDAGKL